MNCRLTGYLAAMVFTAMLGSGCADFSTYMKDRGNDLADCFTLRVGRGYGLGARFQVTNYLGAAVGFSQERKVGYFGREPVEVRGFWSGIPVPQIVSAMPLLAVPFSALSRKEQYFTPLEWLKMWFKMVLTTEWASYEKGLITESERFLGVNLAEFTEPGWLDPPPPFIREKLFIEVGAALFAFGFDVGFNPAEFADFLLGWFSIDLASDDTKLEKSKP
jgi:hypothetical protein